MRSLVSKLFAHDLWNKDALHFHFYVMLHLNLHLYRTSMLKARYLLGYRQRNLKVYVKTDVMEIGKEYTSHFSVNSTISFYKNIYPPPTDKQEL
jgi:hypothetical protein